MLIVFEEWYLIPTHRKERLGFVKEVNVLSPSSVGICYRNTKIGLNEAWMEMSVCESIRRNSRARIKRITCTHKQGMRDSNQSGRHQGIICSYRTQDACTSTSPEHRWLDSRPPALWPQEDGRKAPVHRLPAPATGRQAVVLRCPKQRKLMGSKLPLRFVENEVSNISRPKIAP